MKCPGKSDFHYTFFIASTIPVPIPQPVFEHVSNSYLVDCDPLFGYPAFGNLDFGYATVLPGAPMAHLGVHVNVSLFLQVQTENTHLDDQK